MAQLYLTSHPGEIIAYTAMAAKPGVLIHDLSKGDSQDFKHTSDVVEQSAILFNIFQLFACKC